MKLPRVLVFTVTYDGKDYVYDEFKEQMSKLTYPKAFYRHLWLDNSKDRSYTDKLLGDGLDAVHVERGNNSREALSRCQEYARRLAIEEDYDYILSVESDVLGVPPDIIQRLIGNAKEVVGCYYEIGHEDFRIPCITLPEKHESTGMIGTRLVTEDEAKSFKYNGLITVNGCGLGCTLIHKNIFEKVMFRFYPDLKTHSDSFFMNDVWKMGHRVFVNTDIVLDHRNVPWSTVKDR